MLLSPSAKSKFIKKYMNPKMTLLYSTIPFIIFIFIFSYVPLFGWIYSFFDYRPGVPLSKQEFVGLYNFKIIFNQFSGFYNALRNTLALNLFALLLSPLAIIFAVLLAEVKHSKISRFVQTVTSLPNFISWVLVYSVFFAFFSNEGFVNLILINFGIIERPLDVLGNSQIAWYVQTAVGIWKSLGWTAIIYIATMASIDPELYSAAGIDGAGRFRKIWHITIPGVLPTYIVLVLLQVSDMLSNGFEQYYVFRNPLVAEQLDVLDVFIYLKGIGNAQYAFATAVGMLKSLITIALLLSLNSLSRKIRGNSIV